MSWDVEITLHAVDDDVPTAELRAYYKANETPLLDEILERSAHIRLGTTEVMLTENMNTRGPVGRIDDLIDLRGTSEWPPSALPLLDEDLEHDILNSLEAQIQDPQFEVVPRSQLVEFLARHRGKRLATTSRSI